MRCKECTAANGPGAATSNVTVPPRDSTVNVDSLPVHVLLSIRPARSRIPSGVTIRADTCLPVRMGRRSS